MDMQRICKLLTITAFIMISACAGSQTGSRQASGVYHRVKKGETLYRIAQVYHVSFQQLAEANNIDHVDTMEAGRILFIPGAQAVAEDALVTKVQETEKNIAQTPGRLPKKPPGKEAGIPLVPGSEVPMVRSPGKAKTSAEKDKFPLSAGGKSDIVAKTDKTIFPLNLSAAVPAENNDGEDLLSAAERGKIQQAKIHFRWPVTGEIISRYGRQDNGMYYNGIKIQSSAGTSVIAAAEGVVIFSGPLKNYGETIILKHDNDYASVYTQLGQRLVKPDDHIKQGDKIAILEPSKIKGTAPQLNFEIRYKNKSLNPLLLLP